MNRLLRIGISCGEPTGIGLEVAVKALQSQSLADAEYFLYAHQEHLDRVESIVGKSKAILKQVNGDYHAFEFGHPSPSTGEMAFHSLEAASNDLVTGAIDALVTAPIDKANIQSKDFAFPGHTEYLAAKAEQDEVLMFLVSKSLRMGVVTGHVALSEVAKQVTESAILGKLKLMKASLVGDFGIAKPRIALFGLNPHAGDNGLIGSEEIELIGPTLRKAQDMGIQVDGPHPADGFFGSRAYEAYDGTLALYHDQGLIPFKALSFGGGVNLTAGLPILRSSPDHGTAYDIAGTGTADSSSFKEALDLAHDIALRRANTSA